MCLMFAVIGEDIPHLDAVLDIVQAEYINSIDIDFDKPKLVLLLNKPRLVFNPPINKDNLQEGKGFLSKHYYTFEQFFEAAGL